MKLLELFKKDKTKQPNGVAVMEEIAVTLEQEAERTEEKEQFYDEKDNQTLKALASLMGVGEQTLKREFVEYNVKKFLSLVGRALVRSETMDEDVKRLYYRSSEYWLGGILVSPMYLSSCTKQQKKKDRTIDCGAIIDFPFGEDTVKGKMHGIKESNKAKMDFAIVTIPTVLAGKENLKQLKKQTKKLMGALKKRGGVAINASDITNDDIKRVCKSLVKSKAQSLTLLFGDTPIEEVTEKIITAGANLGDKKLFVLANVQKYQSITELKKLGVDKIFTPFAFEIATEVLQSFGLKEIK